jgi:hypothetical protein
MEKIAADILPGCCRIRDFRRAASGQMAAANSTINVAERCRRCHCLEAFTARYGATQLGPDQRELNRTWADQQLPEKDPAKIRNLHGVAKTCAGDGAIQTIHQGTENTFIFLWLPGHPSKSIDVPTGIRPRWPQHLRAYCQLAGGLPAEIPAMSIRALAPQSSVGFSLGKASQPPSRSWSKREPASEISRYLPSLGYSTESCATSLSAVMTSKMFNPSTTEVTVVDHGPSGATCVPVTRVYAERQETIPSKLKASVRVVACPPTGGSETDAWEGIIF